ARLSTEVELEEWETQVDESKKVAKEAMGVEFIDVDMAPFREKMMDLQKEILKNNPSIRDFYDHIQEINERNKEAK
ncbi:MAG: TRAP transporter substrate-binding protein, partial [Selenomonadaceae bacterium]|nr:TRAP transporter substrate-binding protein [Selenomonadaceae bacterium]